MRTYIELYRTSAYRAGGRGFESRRSHDDLAAVFSKNTFA